MIFINLKGGLGNQMFQYAFGAYLQKKYNRKIFFLKDYFLKFNIHNGYELNKVFNIKVDENNALFKSSFPFFSRFFILRLIFARPFFSKILPKNIITDSFYTHRELNPEIPYYFDGYWQNEELLREIRSDLIEIFRFKNFFDKAEKVLLSKIVRSNASVSIHIRRGDFLNKKKFWSKAITCETSYYINAIMEIYSKVPNPDLYYFSDDPNWVAKNLLSLFPGHLVKRENKCQSYKDMYLMSLCKHNIIANSTFSWWAAWLNTHEKKNVIAPFFWLKNVQSKKIIPIDWKRL